jgi:hypothetical protein
LGADEGGGGGEDDSEDDDDDDEDDEDDEDSDLALFLGRSIVVELGKVQGSVKRVCCRYFQLS